MSNPDRVIRPARRDEGKAIRQMVFRANLDPTKLNWQNFLVAEEAGEIIGIGQIRPPDSCPELGSLVVREDRRGEGIGGDLIRALLATRSDTVYLECRSSLTTYYAQFGFEEIPWWEAPMPLKLKSGMGNTMGGLVGIKIAVMRCQGSGVRD